MSIIKFQLKNNDALEDVELFNNSLYILYSDINNISLQFHGNKQRVLFVHTPDPRSVKLSHYITEHKVSQKQIERLILEYVDTKDTDINDAPFGCQLSFVLADQLPQHDIIIAGLAGLAPTSIAFTAALCNKLLTGATDKLIILILHPGHDISNNLSGKYQFYKIEPEQLPDLDNWLINIEP